MNQRTKRRWVAAALACSMVLSAAVPAAGAANRAASVSDNTSDTSIGKANDKAKGVKFNDGLLPEGSSAPISSPPAVGKRSNRNPMWTMVWNDEFDDGIIDPDKWDYDLGRGEGGWGNNELQYYTNRPENVKEEDGKLIITGRKENYEGAPYTSTRIVTRGKYAQKYGKIEVRASLPTGKGYWPAIWMLPEDRVYGTWAASGEIDIMEAWGSRPGKVAGTIHYGSQWPGNTYTGKEYEFKNGSTIEDFHTYSLEWEPGEMRWYVDGELFSTQNDWYSESAGQPADNAFPAPFDQEFHLLMNLAIGGNFDGNPDETTVFPKTMQIDYVRMYDLTGRAYREPTPLVIEKQEAPEGAILPSEDGNLVRGDWRLFQGEGGKGSVTTESIGGTDFAKINIQTPGWQQYSVQLLTDVTVVKGHYYKLSFDALSSADRSMTVKVTGGQDRGFAAYSRARTYSLTNEVQHFETSFQMKQDSDIAARIEFNVGTNANPVWVGNVRLEEVDGIVFDEDSAKKPLSADGNHVYNGSFDQGNVDRMAFWHFDKAIGVSATANVDWQKRKLNVQIENARDSSADAVRLTQKGIELLQDQSYKLTFDASANANKSIVAALVSKDGATTYATQTIGLTADAATKTFAFTMNELTDHEAQLVFRLGGSKRSITLDNIKLVRTSIYFEPDTIFYPLTNGEFASNLDGWTTGVDTGGALTAVNENGTAKITVTNQGQNPWSSMFIQSGLAAWGGVDYIVSFDALASVDRKMEVILENSAYKRYFDQTVDLTTQMKNYSFEFKMTNKDTVDLKFLLGLITGTTAIGANHDIFIDNVKVEVKNSPVASPVMTLDATDNKVGQPIELTFTDNAAWRSNITRVKINNVNVSQDRYSIEAGILRLAAANFTDDGIYQIIVQSEGYAPAVANQKVFPATDSVALNGDFSFGGNAWGSWAGENGAATISYENGKAEIAINSVGDQTWAVQFFQEAIPVVAGKTYEISFTGSSSVPREATIEFGHYSNAATINLTADAKVITKQFTANPAPMKLNFLLGKTASPLGAHTITIDDVVIKEVAAPPLPVSYVEVGPNLLSNGTFDTDLTGWSVHNQGNYEAWAGNAEFAVQSGTVTAAVYQVGWEWWHIQLFQEGIAAAPGKYKVAFDLVSDVDRPVYVELTGSGAPVKKIDATTATTSYEAILEVSATGSFKFLIGLGRAGADPTITTVPYRMKFDNIRFVKVVEDI